MRPVGNGRPGTQVIPDGWEATHAAVIATTFDCTITIGTLGGKPAWNDETEQMETPLSDPVYSGPASLAPVTDTARLLDVVGDQVPVGRYEVTLAHDAAGITDKHVVHVVTSPDPLLAGRTLTDIATARGRRFSRVLQATLAD